MVEKKIVNGCIINLDNGAVACEIIHSLLFQLLIGILVGWLMSAIMTLTGALTDDPSHAQYMARTDARSGIIKNANWFKVPYPCMYGIS